jgi:hypothetical protein
VVTAGNGLTGGGALSANISLNVGAGTGISVAADTVSVSADVWRDGNPPTAAQIEALGIAGIYTGADANNLNYPVGTVIQVSDSGTTVRNAAKTIYLNAANSTYFQTTSSAAGTLLGVWRARGRGGNDGGSGDTPRFTLFQRTS